MFLKRYVLILSVKYLVGFINYNLFENTSCHFKTGINDKYCVLDNQVYVISLSQLKMGESNVLYLALDDDKSGKTDIDGPDDVRMDSFLFSPSDIIMILELFDDTLLKKTLLENLCDTVDELKSLLKTKLTELRQLEDEYSSDTNKDLESSMLESYNEKTTQCKKEINKYLDFLLRILKTIIHKKVNSFRNTSKELFERKEYSIIEFYYRGLHFQSEIMDYLRNVFYTLFCKQNNFVSSHPLCKYLTSSYLHFLQNYNSIKSYLLKLHKYPKYMEFIVNKHNGNENDSEYEDLSTDSETENTKSDSPKRKSIKSRKSKRRLTRSKSLKKKSVISTKIKNTKTKYSGRRTKKSFNIRVSSKIKNKSKHG
ncbi:hypothetical protein FG386_002346 [Cryptosporidium ryanae]|uniref:uncharacterized protein n=1 Tax=Cryptosporidium ryanae TaxID=515981 RepID=UPI00351A062A|nr:hypothetical protein FG386_002346 [Cryptosporidium ryanae]